MTNNELFFNLYNVLDDELRNYYNLDNFNTSAILKRIKELNDSPVLKHKERAEKLDIIRNLRNSLAHVEKFDNKDNFTISKSLIQTLRYEIDDIRKPLVASNVCKSINQVLTALLDDKIIDITNKMLENGYTHIPVLVNGYLYGVFSENTIFTRFAKQKDLNVSKETTIKEYSEFIQISNHATESFQFVSKRMKAIDILPMFSNKINGKRLVMLFVTEHGKESEKVIGIITSHDLYKIN